MFDEKLLGASETDALQEVHNVYPELQRFIRETDEMPWNHSVAARACAHWNAPQHPGQQPAMGHLHIVGPIHELSVNTLKGAGLPTPQLTTNRAAGLSWRSRACSHTAALSCK